MGIISGNTEETLTQLQQPLQVYAEIDKPNTIYVGPRKADDEAQFTFIWGDGTWMHSYIYEDSEQKSKKGGGGQSGAGNTGQIKDWGGNNARQKPR